MKSLSSRSRTNTRTGLTLAVAMLAALLGPAHADGERMQPRQQLPAYQQECGSCHLAYPAGLLPAGSWRRIMEGLAKHYGSDASLDAQATQQIGAWLQTHAGNNGRISQAPPQDRITKSAWFERKHRRIDPSLWQHTSVMSAAPGRSQASSYRSAQHEGASVSAAPDRPTQAPSAARPGERSSLRAANCGACHTDAASGDFDDDRLRVPPGLGQRFLRAFQGD